MDPKGFFIIFLLCLGSLVCGGGLAVMLWCRRTVASLRREVHELALRMQTLERRSEREPDRKNRLLTSDQLAARFERVADRASADISPKYRYVAHLARSGLGPVELSEILDVSAAEAEQMLILARSAEKAA
ncbi:MAG: hypothetical protein JRJ54_04795 [Deltaproteobacteria bacterium]|nr:hypothetical protein [Deltaproteobacteria bacterium]